MEEQKKDEGEKEDKDEGRRQRRTTRLRWRRRRERKGRTRRGKSSTVDQMGKNGLKSSVQCSEGLAHAGWGRGKRG